MKAPTDLVLGLAAITGVLAVAVIWSSTAVLFKRSPSPAAALLLKIFLLFGIGLLAAAVYIASWGFVLPKR